MRAWIGVGALVGFAASATPGCGEPAGDDTIARDMVEEYIAAICDAMTSCDCREPSFTDRDECFDSLLAEYSEGEALVEERGWRFDRPCTAERIDYIENAGCMSVIEIIQAGLWYDCYTLYFGDAKLGEPCEWAFGARMSDCERGIACSPLRGTCWDPENLPPGLGEGEACADNEGWCADELDCDYFGSGTCVAPAAYGEPCPNRYPCEYPYWCDDQTDPEAPVCAHRKPLGEPCESPRECDSLECFDVCVEREPQACEGDIYL
jgi:hypothetical protein